VRRPKNLVASVQHPAGVSAQADSVSLLPRMMPIADLVG
jgi:hypothetical protein